MADIRDNYGKNTITERPIRIYTDKLKELDPAEVVARTGVKYENGFYETKIFGEDRKLSIDVENEEQWKDKDKILFLRYLLEGRKSVLSSEYAAYADLPWGDVYDKNFKGRCIRRMVAKYGNNINAFCETCEKHGGVRIAGSGVCYELPFMEDLHVRFIIWEGDDEFPSSGQILFSKNFPDAFDAECRVVVCEYMLGKM